MDKMSDRDIIEKIRSDAAQDHEAAFEYLYGLLYSKSLAYIRKNNGTEEDARDIFQDALLAFYKLVRQDRLAADTKAEAYIFSIFRNLWLKKLQKRKRETLLDETLHDLPIEGRHLEELINTEQHALLNTALQALGPDCQSILIAFYYDQLRMDEIVKRLNFSSIQVAKNKKYTCMKKLKDLVLNSDYFRNLF